MRVFLRKHILQAVENSLRRLQTDHIDLYQAHWPDEKTPIEETLRAFDELVKQGKVRYTGCVELSCLGTDAGALDFRPEWSDPLRQPPATL